MIIIMHKFTSLFNLQTKETAIEIEIGEAVVPNSGAVLQHSSHKDGGMISIAQSKIVFCLKLA